MKKIVHMTSVHPTFDVRIFHKECKSLHKAGFDVSLIAPHDKNEVVDGIKILAVPPPKNRLQRMLKTTWYVFRRAMKQKAVLYHFHDPELIPIGVLLKLLGKKVIYDIHEDYVTSIKSKEYINITLRLFIATIFNYFERCCSIIFNNIIAEKYYIERFPYSSEVLNYPTLSTFHKNSESYNKKKDFSNYKLLYTGGVSENRGALIHAKIPEYKSNVSVYLVGYCHETLYQKISNNDIINKNLFLIGRNQYVPFKDIVSQYYNEHWLCGLAIFPYNQHNLRKLLTKFYEYMYMKIPIICSNFPVWKEFVDKNKCGLVVEPNEMNSITKAIDWLIKHPDEANQMGENGHKTVVTKYN
ncbi:MAG: glycosyltransferase [Planctomycetes bacterium]|nr:glycosyltransferase [Planctomycetota bacterium]